MESEEHMNRKQHEAEMAEVEVSILIIITRQSKRVTTEGRRRKGVPVAAESFSFMLPSGSLTPTTFGRSSKVPSKSW